MTQHDVPTIIENNPQVPAPSAAEAPARPRRRRRARRAGAPPPRMPLPEFSSVEAVAGALGISEVALRARLRRVARTDGAGRVVAHLGPVEAIKVGPTWRLRLVM